MNKRFTHYFFVFVAIVDMCIAKKVVVFPI